MRLELSNGGFALVDKEDYKFLSQWKWWGTKFRNGIVPMANIKINGKWKGVRMHTLLLKPTKGFVVDHINHNPLDNRRSNLRICTKQQNRYNSKPVNGVKGVTKQNGKWRVRFSVNGKRMNFGMFSSLEEASAVATKNYQKFHKEFAYGNHLR